MSEPDVPSKNTQKLLQLLMKQLKGFNCLVCGRDEFVNIDEIEKGLQTNVMLYAGDNPTASRHAPTLTIACTHCGRIEQFAEYPLQRRLSELAPDV